MRNFSHGCALSDALGNNLSRDLPRTAFSLKISPVTSDILNMTHPESAPRANPSLMAHRSLPSLPSVISRLEFARKRVGLTQEQAAQAIHHSRRLIQGIESGQRPVKLSELALLADVYGVPLEWLQDGEVPEDGHPSENDGVSRLRGKCLLDLDTYEKVMAAESLAELRQLLPSSSLGFKATVACPISDSCVVVDWAEAQARQQQVEQKVRHLIAEEFAMNPVRQPEDGPPVAFDSSLSRACEAACRAEDIEMARRCMNWSPYFLPLLHFGVEDDVEWMPRSEAVRLAFERMHDFERTFPGLVLEWRRKHDIES